MRTVNERSTETGNNIVKVVDSPMNTRDERVMIRFLRSESLVCLINIRWWHNMPKNAMMPSKYRSLINK